MRDSLKLILIYAASLAFMYSTCVVPALETDRITSALHEQLQSEAEQIAVLPNANAAQSLTPPEPYYLYLSKYGSGSLDDLETLLSEFRWSRPYKSDVFDCSEMSAYIEWYLENNGFDAVIVINTTAQHAWVIVKHLKSADGTYQDYPVETAHNPPRVLTQERFWLKDIGNRTSEYVPGSGEGPYNHPETIFNNIYEAETSGHPQEFDWWNA